MPSHPAYELFEELGRGGNTVVYRSYDLALGREVAIKELGENSRRDARHRERFLREAQFLAQFEHDNVLRVYSVDQERGWIIMELMKGTLASIIAAGPSSPDLVRSVLKQTLEALAFLHEKNKVHGTVRPTNLLINEARRVKLSEFEQTAVGGELRVPTGSKKYLAPELIRPEFGEFGPPLDLYCLGFTALELLKGPQFDSLFPGTGKGAIDADVAWLRWHSSPEELASTRKLVKGIPDDLAHVLDRMLKKRVAERAQTAQEVLKELADRPLVPVSIADDHDEGRPAAMPEQSLGPAVVRTLAPGQQTVLPSATGPGAAVDAPAIAKQSAVDSKRSARRPAKSGPTVARFSKDWFNQQLGRPYVLYPLCAAILLGALWFTLYINSSKTVAKIPVSFEIAPEAAGVEVHEGQARLAASADGTYPLEPGTHALTFRKEGFAPATKTIEVSAQASKFEIQLEPVVRYVDVSVQVTPADAQLSVAGQVQSPGPGPYTFKHRLGDALRVEARRDGFVPVVRTFTDEELAKLNNRISIELQRDKPRLPAGLAAKPGAQADSETGLPARAVSTRLTEPVAAEFVLVPSGTYGYGVNDTPREGEISRRTVKIDQPFYISVHEVTNAQYQQFFASAGASAAGIGWQDSARKWTEPHQLDPVNNRLPVTRVTPQQAQAFCEWLGGRLPTEIEWECAVRGADDRGFPLPWGSAEPTRERCQIFHGELGLVPVDQLTAGATAAGLMHTIGNAAEWCHDSEQPGEFILRGCSFATANIDDVRVTWRRRGNTRGEEDTGFRVVVPLDMQPTAPASPQAGSESPSVTGSFTVFTPALFLYSLPWDWLFESLDRDE